MGKRYRNINNELYVIGNNATKLDGDYNTNDSYDRQHSNTARPNQGHRRVVRKYRYKMKFLAVLCITMLMCIVMLKTQFTVSDRCDNIVKLENKLNNLKRNNKLIEEGMNTNIDLNQVYEIATTKLGMVVPSENQIAKLDVAENSYTEQLNEITETKEQEENITNIFGFILSKGR